MHKLNKYIIMLIMQSITYMAIADIEISPIISNGKNEASLEAEPNVWFVIDNSYSMSDKSYDKVRTKMQILQDSLNEVLFADENKDINSGIRVGYTSFSDDRSATVLPFYGSDETKNRQIVKNWLNNLHLDFKSSTPLPRTSATFIDKIIKSSRHKKRGNPFLEDPTKEYNAKTNKILTCRRNYVLIMTDGGWSYYNDGDKDSIIYAITKTYHTNRSYDLPDGKKYSGTLPPYVHQSSTGGRAVTNEAGITIKDPKGIVATIADIALYAWQTDMDNDASTNNLLPKYTKDTSGNIVRRTDMGSDKENIYWHPWNDPANWQHINVFTMAFFGFSDNRYRINPYNNIDKYLAKSFSWTVDLRLGNIKYSPSVVVQPAQDLANAAFVGRGRYYFVKKADDMKDAFKNLLFESKKGPVLKVESGSAGAVSNSQNIENSYFISRYDDNSFTGELIKYNVFSGNPKDVNNCFGSESTKQRVGAVCKGIVWNAGKILTERGFKDRKIITKKPKLSKKMPAQEIVDFSENMPAQEIVDFSEKNIDSEQRKLLIDNFPYELRSNFSNDEERLAALFNYIKGDGSNEEIFRNRNKHKYKGGEEGRNILGSIVRSSPVFVGIPSSYTMHLGKTGDAYKKYKEFFDNYVKNNKKGEKEVIYVGANDGMLHAFEANYGEELFAYIPAAVYKKLPSIVSTTEKVSLVDGNIDVELVNFGSDYDDDNNSNWQRVLVASMGGGAKGIYALNITAPSSGITSDETIKNKKIGNWEISSEDSDNVGNIIAKPAIIQLQDNTWVAIIGNGYNSKNNQAALIVINLKTGKIIQELLLDNSDYTDASQSNGLGPLYFASYPKGNAKLDNRYDRAYAGDLQGNLWVFDLSNSSKKGGIKIVNNKPLFVATDKKNNRQPITVAPKVNKHPWGYGFLVHFGTGALFTDDDLSSEVGNSIYAIWDDWVDRNGLPTPSSEPVKKDELNDIKLKDSTIIIGEDKFETRHLSDDNETTSWKLPDFGGKHRGWKIDLYEGERAWQAPQTIYGSNNSTAIGYNTVKYKFKNKSKSKKHIARQSCEGESSSVKSWSLVFNNDDAARKLISFGALDVNKDGVINKDDMPGSSLPATSVARKEDVLLNSPNQVINKNMNGSSGSSGSVSSCNFNRMQTSSSASALPNGVTTKRCSYFTSWRELN